MLDNNAITTRLRPLDGWQRKGDTIEKQFRFADFRAAIAFLVRVGFEAEALEHHPEIHNDYNRVTLTLTTHDEGGLTEKDLALAEAIEELDTPGA